MFYGIGGTMAKYDDLDMYDDIDEVGMFNYDSDDTNSNYDEINLEDEFDYDDSAAEDFSFEEESETFPSKGKLVTGEPVAKTYSGEFDLSIAENLYYTEATESSQIKAIEYAEFFAKRRIYEAQYFIIDVIQNQKTNVSHDVAERARTAFVIFFRNYVRTTVEQFYEGRSASYSNAGEKYEDIQDAMAFCWVYILNDIYKYDHTRANLTTYFEPRIRDAISNFEAKKRFRMSKATMNIDKFVSRAQTELIEHGFTPTDRLVAMYCKNTLHKDFTMEQIKLSTCRLLAENTMSRIDADDSIAAKKKQSRFIHPEEQIMMKERTSELISAFRTLTEIEKKVYELYHGVIILIDDNEIIDSVRQCSYTEIAKQLGIDAIEVRRIEFATKKKLQNIITKQTTDNAPAVKKDKLLRNRSLTFSKSPDDDDLAAIIDSITAITD